MRNAGIAAAAGLLAAIGATGVAAQMDSGKTSAAKDVCASMGGTARTKCFSDAKRAEQEAAKGGRFGPKDAKLVNDTNAAAQVKAASGDFAGAAALYQQAIAANPKSPVLHHLYAGLAVSHRRQGIAAYNAAGQPTYPPAGASNEAIRAANAANAGLQSRKSAAALPLVRQALGEAVQAATLADAGSDHSADGAIGVELRENAELWYRLDPVGVRSTPRDSAVLEATWLRRWMTDTNPLGVALAAKYGIPVAAALTAKDPAAGLTLADEVQAKTGSDMDGAIGYAEIVAAAKTPAGDPHRAKALAGLTAAEAGVTDPAQKRHIGELRAALSAA